MHANIHTTFQLDNNLSSTLLHTRHLTWRARMLSGTALHMHGTASPGLTMDSAFGESSAKRALSFTECFAAPSEAETKTPRTLFDSENRDDTLGRPGHAVPTSRVWFDSAVANGPASVAFAGPAPQQSPRRAEDGDDAGYNYVAAKDFLNIHHLSQPPNLPIRADDSGWATTP